MCGINAFKPRPLPQYGFLFFAIGFVISRAPSVQSNKFRELAIVLYEKVKENASIDWTIKENVKAKLKVIVKRVLRRYGYPPDMEMLATETSAQAGQTDRG